METLTNPQYIKALMKKHGVHFSKGLGQNFIIDPDICPAIVGDGGASPEAGALEIGPGIGVLTRELAKSCKKVVSLEIDASLLPVLKETLSDMDNVEILHADVLKTDLHALLSHHFEGMDVIVCANLPYYITSPILMYLLESRLPVKSVTVMVQKEAAQRICARLPSRQAGAITAAVHYYSSPRLLFPVSRESFLPPPKVDSAVIRLDILQQPPVTVTTEALLFRVIRGAFSQRRKTILNSLTAALALDKAVTARLLADAEIPATARPEALSLEQFAAIANTVGAVL